jgi:hypothetical protein
VVDVPIESKFSVTAEFNAPIEICAWALIIVERAITIDENTLHEAEATFMRMTGKGRGVVSLGTLIARDG